jgi:hypothetical protein
MPLRYFVIIARLVVVGGASPGMAGEITNVTHAFEPSARWDASNSL